MTSGISAMPLTLVPNPSHLEFVNPVVEGQTRAAQEKRDKVGDPEQDPQAALAIAIHGDAAFPGEGIVAETFNLAHLRGYSVGGTLHVIVNNQVGFTTEPVDSRSTRFASDLAKGFEMPIIHVNADDPEACVIAMRIAVAYRTQFGRDFLVDLVGYRRHGHNEGDEPTYTQPLLYEKIKAHPTPRQVWGARLVKEGVVVADDVPAAALVATAPEAGAPLLVSARAFDRFADPDRLGAERVSLAFHLVFQADDRTLTDEEVNTLHEEIVEKLVAKFGVKRR